MSVTLHKGEDCNFLTNVTAAIKLPQKSGRLQTIFFNNPVHIIARSAVVGDKESKGPIGKYFKNIKEDTKLGEKSFERAEIKMLDEAIRTAITDANLKISDIDVLLSGDLLNQLTSSSYVARDLDIPNLGIYSACSTMTQALSLGAAMINAGYFKTAACATASHFATAERQFRYPLEYGCQRPPYAQWTVTASGCTILSSEGEGPRITSATFGKVIDFGTNDLSNMGAAMAPDNAIIDP